MDRNIKNNYIINGEHNEDLEEHIIKIYNNIELPEQKTLGSVGRDFVMPVDITIQPGGSMMIPPEIRCNMSNELVMLIFPRSSLGIKKNLYIANTIPVVDSDYYYADNEGHIFVKIGNRGDSDIEIKAGESFVQAVFVLFVTADCDVVNTKRSGGIGSTNERG